MEYSGTLWKVMEHYGRLQNILESYGNYGNLFYRNPWNVMEGHGTHGTVRATLALSSDDATRHGNVYPTPGL